MALIEVFHVVASELPIDAVNTTDIPQGLLVGLDGDGYVIPCNGDSYYAIGIAGDSRSAGTTSYTPESGSALSRDPATTLDGALVIGVNIPPNYTQRFTQNRVADNYNEVLASGKMTVYHSGGEFWTDQYEIIGAAGGGLLNQLVYTPGLPLYASGTETQGQAAYEPEAARAGRFTTEPNTAIANVPQIVGFILTAPTAYPSGVPGTNVGYLSGLGGAEGGNSLSYGTFLHVKLAV